MNKSDSIAKLAEALAKCQGQLKPASKNVANSFYKSQYAALPDVMEACREPMAKNGLAVVQTMDTSENGMVLETILMHSSGEWVTSLWPINPVKPDPQGIMSAVTYGRRGSLMAILGIVADDASDDDGNAASGYTGTYQPTPNRLTAAPPARSIAELEDEGREAAEGGLVPLQAWWSRLAPQHKVGLQAFKDSVLKPLAEKVA